MELILLSALTFVAATIGTIAGFGTSTLMVPVVVLFYPLPVTLLFVGIIHLFGDVWKVLLFRSGFHWKIILLFGVPGIFAAYWGAQTVFAVSDEVIARALGIFLFAYAVFIVLDKKFGIPPSGINTFLGGAMSGFLAGVFGVGGAVRTAFLAAYDLPKEVHIATMGAIALFVDTTRLGAYFSGGAELPMSLLYGLPIFIGVSFLGAEVGKKIIQKVPQERFRYVIASALLLASGVLVFAM